MMKYLTLLTISSIIITGCNSKEELPLISAEIKKDEQYIEDIVYCIQDGKKDTLFRHAYFLKNDSVSHYQKDYLNVGVKTEWNRTGTGDHPLKSIQWTIIEDTKVTKHSNDLILDNSFCNYKTENLNSGRMSIGISLVMRQDGWSVLTEDRDLSISHRLPEYILEEVSSKGVNHLVHTRVIADSKEILAFSKVYSSI